MLVLMRGEHQSVRIGDEIIVTIVEIRGDKVRLGFTAPDDTPINREEIHHAIKSGIPRRKR